jgi:hypothetical protein
MNYREIVQEINAIQLKTFVLRKDFTTAILPAKQRGLYWLWTNLSYDDLEKAKSPQEGSRHVSIASLIRNRKELQHICKEQHNGYQMVYNGIGGYKIESKGSCLRSRILQEFTASNYKTGSLNISNTDLLPENWAISFFNFDDERNKKLFPFLNEEQAYKKYAAELEKLWRLEYGHPILCRH